MYQFKKISLFCLLIVLNSCKKDKEEEKVKVNPPEIHILSNQNSKFFTAQMNSDGSFSPYQGEWIVPEHVTSVKVIGCSGGNAGGGGGAGGAGASYYMGSWFGASWGGNASAGGGANGHHSGQPGQLGQLGKYREEVGGWYSAEKTANGYPQAVSAKISGTLGKEGEGSIFGPLTFSKASENTKNIDNTMKINSKFTEYAVCLGGFGGRGGKGGHGSYFEYPNFANGQSRYFHGGIGGKGGDGLNGYHSIIEEHTLNVTPGTKFTVYVGVGGKGGIGSKERSPHQGGDRVMGSASGDGFPGEDGQNGRPGIIYIEWIGK